MTRDARNGVQPPARAPHAGTTPLACVAGPRRHPGSLSDPPGASGACAGCCDDTGHHVRLIDGFDVSIAGASIELSRGCQRLVAFLALWERPVLRSFVSGNLWPDSDIEHANASLRTTLWRLSTGRRSNLVNATNSHVSLHQLVSVDYHDALAWSRQAITTATEPLPAPWTLAKIDTLAGDILPDWYDDWVLVARERFRQLRLHALEALCEQLTATRRFGEALMAGLGAIQIEPLRESAHRMVIAVHLQEENQIEAMRQYRSYEQLLFRELSLQPSASLRSLVFASRRATTS